MEQELFSESLPEFSGRIDNTALAESLTDLSTYLQYTLKLLEWSESQLAVSLLVEVDLPPLGNYEAVDIRSAEPVLIVFSLIDYPNGAPLVYSDRLDFPKDTLAHLYVATGGKPPAFCLIRGSITEWYANKQLKDLVIRIRNWFRDAASGELTEDGNQFEPLRLEGYNGTIIYDYDLFSSIVTENRSYFPNQNFAIALFEANQDEKGLSFKYVKLLTPETLKETFTSSSEDFKKDKGDLSKKYYRYGYILWSTTTETFSHYSVDLPGSWETFLLFCEKYGINTDLLEEQIASFDLNIYTWFPVILAINRPKQLIGFSSTIEFINLKFKVDSDDVIDDKISSNFPISFQSHNQPLSQQLAKRISGFEGGFRGLSIIFGCGALGSKLIMHFARSGNTNLFLVDPDTISPHNLVRYALTAESLGLNKAYALKQAIQQIYSYEELSGLFYSDSPTSILQSETILPFFKWVFDFTASNNFLNTITKAQLAPSAQACRAYITDQGNLGVLLIEGTDRNPRLDDLQTMLYAEYQTNSYVSEWIQREGSRKSSSLQVTVGVGCNSETTVLADDIISLHAAHFSGIIKADTSKESLSGGKIFLNRIVKEPEFSNQSSFLSIPPLLVFSTKNESVWQIRMKPDLLNSMMQEMTAAMPNETGGIFIGCANQKTKTIHVVDLITAPSDSKANPICFFRGMEGLPEKIEEITRLSGNQIGYIGEWHSHPFGPNALSQTDLNTVSKCKAEFCQLTSPLPVFLMILTPEEILPFVF